MEQFTRRLTAQFDSLWPGEAKRLVLGEGCWEHPRFMLIGEAPGEQETLQGRPFVGKAGKNLDQFLEVVGLKREEIWISNVVKIRPTKTSEKGRVSNRPPSREERLMFEPYLREEILLVSPRVVVTLGNVALQAFTGGKGTIGEFHGRLCEAIIATPETSQTVLHYPLYHPASVIYNRALKDVYHADLLNLRRLMDEGVI